MRASAEIGLKISENEKMQSFTVDLASRPHDRLTLEMSECVKCPLRSLFVDAVALFHNALDDEQ